MKKRREQKNKEIQVNAINSFKQMREHAMKNEFMSNDDINAEIELARKNIEMLDL